MATHLRSLLAVKSVNQPFQPDETILKIMETFRQMTNECVSMGLQNNVSTMKHLSKLSYSNLRRYEILSLYKLHAISRAAGILAARKKSIKRGRRISSPYAVKPLLVNSYQFKIIDGMLMIPIGDRKYSAIPLNDHVKSVLSSEPDLNVRSYTLTDSKLVLCYSKEVPEIECTRTAGIDRNLDNLTVGNSARVIQYDVSKANRIAENTSDIVASFVRNDVRIRRKIAGKYGRRRTNRVKQLIHHVSKKVVRNAKAARSALAFEDIRFIRRLYQGNYQGRKYRGRMNGWSFAEAKRQIEYKAAWEGVPVIQLTKKETKGTSKLCYQCGERLQDSSKQDWTHRRQLWCPHCQRWFDRDIVASMNVSLKGLARFASSKGLEGEAMKGNPTTPVILRVDASKLARESCLFS